MNGAGQPVTPRRPRTRKEMIMDYLKRYPIDTYADWYKKNLSDFYLGWEYATENLPQQQLTQALPVKKEGEDSWKRIAIILGVLGAFATVTIFLIFYFFGEAVAMFLPQ